MTILKDTYEQILTELGNAPIESGGIIGERGGTICAFFKDSRTKKREYRPDIRRLNKVIERWAAIGIRFIGIAHSHPNGLDVLSPRDKAYGAAILTANPHISSLIFPLVTITDGGTKITFYELTDIWRVADISVI